MNMNYCCAVLSLAKPAFNIIDDHPCQSYVLAFPHPTVIARCI